MRSYLSTWWVHIPCSLQVQKVHQWLKNSETLLQVKSRGRDNVSLIFVTKCDNEDKLDEFCDYYSGDGEDVSFL